jgi:hypothetical protein
MKKEIKTKEIVISSNSSIKFGNNKDNNGDTLIIGNFRGICGDVKFISPQNDNNDWRNIENYMDTIYTNCQFIINTIENGNKIYFAGTSDSIKYWENLLYYMMDADMLFEGLTISQKRNQLFKHAKSYNMDYLYNMAARKYKEVKTTLTENEINKRINDYVINNLFGDINKSKMKFKHIILNPPYDRNLHLDFLEKGLDYLTEDGRMVIIEPATWLINIRNNNKFGKKVQEFALFERIKQRINGHVESIVIENFNKEFGTGLFVPFSITTIDMSRTFDKIDCNICGEHKEVSSIYDCNLIGKYETIWSILEKVHIFGDVMKNHITQENKGNGYWYAKYAEMVSLGGCAATTSTVGLNIDSHSVTIKTSNGDFCTSYLTTSYHTYNNEISNTPLCSYDRGKHLTDKIADNIYGTKEELENWKHFIFNNKLPLFINIVMTIDQNNNSKDFLPWLVDNQYTDEEINELFNFTDEEIKLIDTTIRKYERNSPWFKRYMCGKDAVTDKEVMDYIQEISK